MTSRAPHRRHDAGESLLELLVAVALLGTASVSILAGFGTLIKTSAAGKKTADTATVLTAAAESVSDNVRNPYQADCQPLRYDPLAGVTLPAGVAATEVSIDAVRYWDGDEFVADAELCVDDTVPEYRLQLVTVAVRTSASERTIDVVKRG